MTFHRWYTQINMYTGYFFTLPYYKVRSQVRVLYASIIGTVRIALYEALDVLYSRVQFINFIRDQW